LATAKKKESQVRVIKKPRTEFVTGFTVENDTEEKIANSIYLLQVILQLKILVPNVAKNY
jgi:hypothetical protein